MKQLIQSPISTALLKILKTRRPTNDPNGNVRFMHFLLHKNGIKNWITDPHGNTHLTICHTDGSLPKTCFTSHTDTVDNKRGDNMIVVDHQGMASVLGGGVLGADDGAGMYIMLEMILEDVPGHYVFFSTEEQGRVGSSKYNMPEHVQVCVSFDRKGTKDLITHQMGERGCSDAFADSLIAQLAQHGLDYEKDPTGSFTDSYSFFSTVPECINLSCGYYNQHTKQESLDTVFLEHLIDAVVLIDWESLAVERDPSKIELEDDWGWHMGKFGSHSGYKFKSHALRDYNMEDYEDILDESDTLLELCTDYPDVAAALLDTYAITVQDFKDFGGVR